MFLKSEAARQIESNVYRSAQFLLVHIFRKAFSLCCFRRHCSIAKTMPSHGAISAIVNKREFDAVHYDPIATYCF